MPIKLYTTTRGYSYYRARVNILHKQYSTTFPATDEGYKKAEDWIKEKLTQFQNSNY